MRVGTIAHRSGATVSVHFSYVGAVLHRIACSWRLTGPCAGAGVYQVVVHDAALRFADYLFHVAEVVGYAYHEVPVVEYNAVRALQVWSGDRIAHFHGSLKEVNRTQGDVEFPVKERFVQRETVKITSVTFALQAYARKEVAAVGA